ncbi:N-acetylmuramoyl-L-alanine amidase, partial [bacterium]|nr:N-acetylmuramoyl-L-alanine amidase [bacterium]
KEKTIVLALSKKLRSYLEKMGYSVLMTREKDIFIPLRNRPKFANSNNGDLFISLHANFAYNPKVKGFDIYYLSKSASDDESREVAAYENNVIKLEREHKQDMLGEIIWSMMSNEFENESITLAGMVSRDLKKITPANGNPVKHARFYVLYGATMPAILIESGFLSNRSEARNLVKASHQDKLTKSIAEAIDAYIVKNYRKFINGN